MSLASANDPSAPGDYFLFVANDNAFVAHPADRLPTVPAGAATAENGTMSLACRVTIVPEPASLVAGAGLLALARRPLAVSLASACGSPSRGRFSRAADAASLRRRRPPTASRSPAPAPAPAPP